jgi:hypothetical protein
MEDDDEDDDDILDEGMDFLINNESDDIPRSLSDDDIQDLI